MTVLGLKDIHREENGIYYRRKFSANAEYELPLGREETGKIEFIIETSPFGSNAISVNLIDPVNYPVIQVKRALKEYIDKLDSAGKLP